MTIFNLKQLKRWLGENTILTTRLWPNGNYGFKYSLQVENKMNLSNKCVKIVDIHRVISFRYFAF